MHYRVTALTIQVPLGEYWRKKNKEKREIKLENRLNEGITPDKKEKTKK